jgi:LysM repeat protein
VDDWRRYAAPAAFLLVVTVAVVLIRSGVESGHSAGPTRTFPPLPATTPAPVTTTKAKTKKPTHARARRYWTVQAGDTFGVISAKTGVPVATIQQLNPGVSSTSLVIGQKVRIA